MIRTIEHQQGSIKKKWENTGAKKDWLRCHGQFNWIHPKTLSRGARQKSRKLKGTLADQI